MRIMSCGHPSQKLQRVATSLTPYDRRCPDPLTPQLGQGSPLSQRSRAAIPTPIAFATSLIDALSGGSSRAMALSLDSCPYRATLCSSQRPHAYQTYRSDNHSDTGSPGGCRAAPAKLAVSRMADRRAALAAPAWCAPAPAG